MPLIRRFPITIVIFLLFFGCASIPKESATLSEELGLQINSLEKSHIALLHSFFAQKREAVDNFIKERWIPVYAGNLFEDPGLKEELKELCNSSNTEDLFNAYTVLGTQLQSDINDKRTELIKPLDELEKNLEEKIRNEYNVARSINNSLTSYLYSASKVEENRNRYLEMLGVTQDKINTAIDNADKIVDGLVKAGDKATEIETKGAEYLKKLNDLKNSLK